MFEPPALRPRRLVTPRKSGTEDQTTAQPTLDPQLTATPTYLTTPMVGTVASSSSTPAPASPAPAPATSPGPSPAEAPSVSESGAPPTPSTASGDTAAPTPTPASATQPSGAATPAAAPGTTTSTAPGPTPSAAPAPTPASAGAPQPSSSTAHLAAQPRTAAAPQATAATHAATPAARAVPGRARAGGVAATAERDDDEADIVEDIGDTQAASQLVQEWFAEAPVMFDDAPLDASFEAPTQIALRVTPPPAPRPEEGAADQAIGPDEAARQAGEMYARGAAQAHDAHDALINDANRAARRIFDQASDAIAKLDFQIQPTLDELVTTLTFNRRELDGAVDAANAHIEAEARTARRRAGGVAASGRARVTATAQHAVNVELPAVRTELRGDFTSLYMRVADAIAKSGTDTRTELQKPSKHQEMIGKPEYVAGGPVQEDAANEAARAEIPPRMNHLGDTIQRSANQTATPTRGRLDTQPTGGGQSMGQGIDNFINSMRDNITGNAASAAVSAAQRALPTGGAMGALVEGAKAFVNTASTGSLEQRGHTAINRSHGEAMRSLASQARAARKAVLHAKRNGQRMFVTQRAGALTRLAGVRRMRIEALKEVANQSAKALRGGARSATTFYSDAARRFGDTLKRAAERGPSALTQTMREGAPTVTRAITEGQRVQTGRLNQVEQGAQTQVGRLSASTSVDAQGAAADFGRNMNDIGAQLRTQTDDAATAHSRHFNEVTRGISQTTQGFTQPLRVMFKAAITDTQKNLKPILKAETTALEGMQKRAEDNNKAVVTDPNTQLGERLRGAKRERDDNLGRRANAMNGAFGTLNLQEDLLMEQSRGVTALGGASILDKIPSLWGRIVYEHDRTIGGLDDDEFNAIKNYLAGRTAEGAKYELRTTVHWYGNEGGRATKIMDEIGGEARRQLTASGDWPALAADVRDGLRGTDRNVFDALAIDRPALARAYRMIEGIDRARESNNSDALFTAVTPYTGEVIRDGRVVSAEEQLQETQREFAVARGLVAAPNDISQADAARALADYATRPVTVLVNEGDVEHPNYVERTYTLSGPDAMLARALATGGPNSEDARAARMLRESERTGKPNLEQLENAVVDPRLNPALTPELTDQQRADARQQQDQLFLRYADMARQAGVQVQGTTPREIREFLAGRLGARYGDSAEERQGARYAGSIVLEDRPNPVAAMRYAMMGSGTKMDLLRRTFGRLSREDVRQLEKDYEHETHRSLVGDLGVYGHGPGEVSGDERLEIEVAMMGVPRTDRERAEVALYKNLQQQRETGVAGRAALRGSEDERMMLGAEANLRRTMGGTVDYDEYGRPVSTGGAFDQRGRYTGPNDTAFLLAVNRATHTAENYAAAIDRLASTITTIIAIVGAVVAAVLTVVTAGAAGPLMIAALSFGLASMGANALIRGGRYGWEEALTDLGMVGVQVLTAGLGAQLGAAAKGANAAATAARAGGPAVARTGLMRLFTGNRVVDQIIIGAITGGVGGVGQTALQAQTWRDGLAAGIGESLLGGLRGSLSGAATAAVTNVVEAMPVGRGALAAMRAGGEYRSLGDSISRLGTGTGAFRVAAGVAGRSTARAGLQALGGVAGRSTELAFDSARGRYSGSLTQALDQIGEAGVHAGLQGAFEGGAEAFGQRRRDVAHPEEAQHREEERMRQIAAESELMRRGVHAQAEAASAPAVAAPAAPDASALGARRGPTAETETRPTPRGEAPEADLPAARRAAAPGEEEAAPGRPRPSDIEELTGRPRAAEAEAQRAQQLAVEGAAARIAGSEMQLAPQRVIVDEPAAINRALGQVTGEGGPLKGRVISDEPHPDGGRRLVLERADGERVSVRVVVGETEGNNVANFARGAAGDDWVVTLSPRARESTHARALAHELEELRFHGLPADRVGAGDVLQARVGANPDAPLSAHDRGRLAEMQVLGEALRAAHAQGDVAQVARLQRDMDSLAGHLGLLHADAADPRMARVREAIPEGHPARGELDDARTRARTPGADDALHPARPITDDTHLSPGDRRRLAEFDETAHRLADAHARGDAQEIFRLTRELADRASRLGLLDTDAATDRRAALARSQFEDDSVAARALDRMRAQFTRPGDNDALRPGLVPEPGTVLSPRDRQRMADLDTAVARLAAAEAAGADAPTLARLRHDAESQAAALGLVHGRAADARSQLASTGLSAESVARLDAIRALARDNPLLRPRTGTLEDIPLLARQIRRAQEMGDTRLAAELTEIAGMRLHEAGLTGGADATARAQARAELARIIGNDPVARTLADDAMQRQFARQRAGLLRDEASNVRAEISQAQERLQAAASTRKEVGPGVLKRTPEEVQVRREIAALERRAAALDDAASRAERIAFRAPGATVEAALAARADDPMFAIAPRLRSDPDYPGNPTQVRLITQMYGDSPQFQSWHAFKQAYYDLNPSTARGAIGHNPEHVEGVVFAAWRAGGFVSESTGRVQSLRDLERVPIAPGVDVAPAPGATRRLPDTLDINVRVRDANGQLVEQPLPVPAAEARRRQLIDDRQDARRRMDTAKTEAQRTAAKAEVNELTARINDVSEALGVAAGRQFASERFGSTGTLTEGRGAGVPDLIHEAPNNGRITVIECKGGTSELGERRATREGRAVMAEQGSPEYLRSLALDMQESGNAEMRRLGDRIIEALDRSPPNIDYVVVRQPFDDTGGRGPFTVSQHPIERSGK